MVDGLSKPENAMDQKRQPKKLHQSVVDTIVRRILTEEYKEGERIPSLETLAEELGASRTTIREAMRVLAAKGFVESRQRAGTRINPRSQWHLLDREVLKWLLDGNVARGIGESLLVLRRILEPEAAALAAQNASARQLADLEEAYQRMYDSLPDDINGCCNADVEFHKALLTASGNPFIEQLAHTIHTALLVAFELSTRLAETHLETLSLHGALVDHVRAQNPSAARESMQILLDKAENDLNLDAPVSVANILG